MVTADDVEALITRNPGVTEAEIATALLGDAGSKQRINTLCLHLMKSHRIERSGRGGRSDPFRYFPKGALAAPAPQVKRRGFYPF